MLYHDGVLRGVNQFKNASIPPRFSTPSAAKMILLLSQLCMDPSEAEKFRNDTFSNELEMHQVANDIELRVFKLMWKLEGVQDVDKEYEDNKKKNSTRASQPTYLGIGLRLRKWKKEQNLEDDEVENAVRVHLGP